MAKVAGYPPGHLVTQLGRLVTQLGRLAPTLTVLIPYSYRPVERGGCGLPSPQQIPQRFRAVAEALRGNTHAIQHRDVQVAQRRILRRRNVLAGLDATAAPPAQQDREVVRVVLVAVRQAGPAHDHRVVEQGPLAFLDPLEPGEQVGELL